MKKILGILICAIICSSCEDVIELELENESSRLIVDALIRVDTQQEYTEAAIYVSLSSSFFDTIEPVAVDSMQLEELNSETRITYQPMPNRPGWYYPAQVANTPVFENEIRTSFLTNSDANFKLTVNYNDQTYAATANFISSVPIDSVVQGDEQLFNEDAIEVIIAFTDVANQEDYYIYDFGLGQYLPTEDRFYDGQQFEFSYFYDDEDVTADSITVRLLGVDLPFYTYMQGIIEQSEQGQNGPFQTPTATVRGNFINIDENTGDASPSEDQLANYVLGYFAISEQYSKTLTLE